MARRAGALGESGAVLVFGISLARPCHGNLPVRAGYSAAGCDFRRHRFAGRLGCLHWLALPTTPSALAPDPRKLQRPAALSTNPAASHRARPPSQTISPDHRRSPPPRKHSAQPLPRRICKRAVIGAQNTLSVPVSPHPGSSLAEPFPALWPRYPRANAYDRRFQRHRLARTPHPLRAGASGPWLRPACSVRSRYEYILGTAALQPRAHVLHRSIRRGHTFPTRATAVIIEP